MRSWGITDTGLVRHENQDSYGVRTIAGFTSSQAKYGADYCGADWNQQALKKAKEEHNG